MKHLEGKTAFITGGSSGAGLGLVKAFASAGLKVVFTYKRQAHLDEAMAWFEGKNLPVHPIHVDVTDRPGMARAAAEAQKFIDNMQH